MKHKVELVHNLMYKGCEPHWHCTYCDVYIPFHCYSKEDLENMDCEGIKMNNKNVYCNRCGKSLNDLRGYENIEIEIAGRWTITTNLCSSCLKELCDRVRHFVGVIENDKL